MRGFFIFSAAYLAFGVALVFLVREDPATLLQFALLKTVGLLTSLQHYLKYFGIFLIAALFVTRHYGFKNRIVPALYALFGCLLFTAAFSLVKTTIPYIVPFYADELFMKLDFALHLGHDPWQFTHQFAEYLPVQFAVFTYLALWTLPAIFLPLLVALTDTDTARMQRYAILHVVCWVGLGNVIALAFSSVGPIYYDRLLGAERFDDLLLALETSGVTASRIGEIQGNLWTLYVEEAQAVGSGISAFPSVHVGVATVFALYLSERSKWLAPFGFAFLAAILFLSVYLGYHYALDGYASIIVIVAAWAALRRRNVAFASYTPA